MTKKQRVLAVLRGEKPDHTPVGFSLHFPADRNSGEAGVQAHLEFFRETDTDIIKIMNENLVPAQGTIQKPRDWSCIVSINKETPFIKKQLDFTKAILDRYSCDGYTLGTLHGITASSIHPIEQMYGYDGSRSLLLEHLRENEGPVLDAMKRIAEGMCALAWGYREAGVNGIYYAALGGETRWFTDEEFARWVEPFDRLILSEIRKAGRDVFLHICKDGLNMERYRGYGELCDAVNWGVYEAPLTLEDGQGLFPGKALMGGLPNRSSVMTEGSREQLTMEAQQLIRQFSPTGFILGADCTLPTEIPYERVRWLAESAREIVL